MVSVGRRRRRVPAVASLGLLYYVTTSCTSQKSTEKHSSGTETLKKNKKNLRAQEFFLLKVNEKQTGFFL